MTTENKTYIHIDEVAHMNAAQLIALRQRIAQAAMDREHTIKRHKINYGYERP